jgi:hypothetical protein
MYDAGQRFGQTGQPAELAMALLPGARPAAKAAQAAARPIENAITKGIRAYHGTPHDFDRFDMSKIGTGEGAQAYGHGLYFAENENVAKWYRDTLSQHNRGAPAKYTASEMLARGEPKTGEDLVDVVAATYGNSRETVLNALRGELGADSKFGGKGSLTGWNSAKNPITRFRKRKIVKDAIKHAENSDDLYTSKMYEVNINASPDEFLDWDQPLSQQSEKVRGAARAVLGDAADNYRGDELVRALERDPGGNAAVGTGTRAAAAAALREAGLPGIRYLDGASRTAGEGSRNYVVFDDNLIEIMRKYGLVPPAAVGAAAVGMPQDAEAGQ